MRKKRLRALLWFDCAAAAIAGLTLFSLSGVLAAPLGLPRSVLVAMALVNLAYGGFSYSLARKPETADDRVRALVIANGAWSLVCVALAVVFACRGSWLGVGYVLLEGTFVAALALLERNSLRFRAKGGATPLGR